MPRLKRKRLSPAELVAELIADLREPVATPLIRVVNMPGTEGERIAIQPREGGRWYFFSSTMAVDFDPLAKVIKSLVCPTDYTKVERFCRASTHQ